MTQEEIKVAIKEKATEIAKKHSKAMLTEFNAEVLPLAMDLATAMIPGPVDDAIAAVAKPVIKSTLDELIGHI